MVAIADSPFASVVVSVGLFDNEFSNSETRHRRESSAPSRESCRLAQTGNLSAIDGAPTAITRPRLDATEGLHIRKTKETLMEAQQLLIEHPCVMSDPEWIALESIDEQTNHFVFDVSMLQVLKGRGLVESAGERWRITERGQRRLHDRRC
ncbi:hypothetical protein [Bosea vaviloviae]|uniref:hypothetical protein n=1 Tax=Bosea vaviloviae TaxID=1526658 RepID=UPI0012E212AE|nr:hypothetical protein [Bosea vaviloviae]